MSKAPTLPSQVTPPAFVLMSRQTLDRVAAALSQRIENRYEYPVDPHRVTFPGARDLDRQLVHAPGRGEAPEPGTHDHDVRSDTHAFAPLCATLALFVKLFTIYSTGGP